MTQQPQPPQPAPIKRCASCGAPVHKEPAALHAENEALRSGYDASRLEIESLRVRVQELGQMLRENRSKRIVALEAENLGLLHALAAEQDANTDLRQQLEAIGAGGVEPLRRDHFRGATKMVPDQFRGATKMMAQEPVALIEMLCNNTEKLK